MCLEIYFVNIPILPAGTQTSFREEIKTLHSGSEPLHLPGEYSLALLLRVPLDSKDTLPKADPNSSYPCKNWLFVI